MQLKLQDIQSLTEKSLLEHNTYLEKSVIGLDKSKTSKMYRKSIKDLERIQKMLTSIFDLD